LTFQYRVEDRDGNIIGPGKEIMRVDLYQDIKGEYLPILFEPDKFYRTRPDGRIEEVTIHKRSTRGKVVKSLRGRIR
jgi:hypothetical protein